MELVGLSKSMNRILLAPLYFPPAAQALESPSGLLATDTTSSGISLLPSKMARTRDPSLRLALASPLCQQSGKFICCLSGWRNKHVYTGHHWLHLRWKWQPRDQNYIYQSTSRHTRLGFRNRQRFRAEDYWRTRCFRHGQRNFFRNSSEHASAYNASDSRHGLSYDRWRRTIWKFLRRYWKALSFLV